MEYACAVWSPYTTKDINLLEDMQKARSVPYVGHEAVIGILLLYLGLFPIMIVTTN